MIPATYDFSVVRGTSGPTQGLVVRLKARDGDDLVNIPYDDVRLSIYRKSELVLRVALSDAGLQSTDPSEAEVTWAPSAAQTRLIPVGAKARYELEVRNGVLEIVYLRGTITGIGGLNDDETSEP